MNSLQLTAHQVFADLQPRRVIIDLKLPLEETDQGLITSDPQNPECKLQIEGSDFVSLRYGDPITACNLFDFVAIHLGSYQEAVDCLYNRFFNLAVLPPGVTWGSVRDHLVEGLQAERKQFKDILSLREPLRRHCSTLGSVYMYCRRLHLSPDHSWPMFYAATADELNRALRPQSPFPALEWAEPYLIFPYFKNHHSFSLLQVERIDGTRVRTVKLNPSRFMYFGLHSCLPGLPHPRVYATRQEALLQSGGGVGALHVLFEPRTELMPRPSHKAVFIITDKSNFNTVAQNQLAFQRLDVASPAKPTEPLPWRDYALNHIIATINRDRNYSPGVAALVQSIKNDSVVFRELLRCLEKNKADEFIERIWSELGPQPLFSDGEFDIVQVPMGYAAVKCGSNARVKFTNFVIEITKAIFFEDGQDIYFGGSLSVGGSLFPFMISEQEIAKPQVVVMRARRAAKSTGIRTELPTVFDPAFEAYLARIITIQLKTTDQLFGVQRLGWNRAKTQFVTPTWKARADGVQLGSRIIHPGSAAIRGSFSTQDYATGYDDSNVSPQARHIIALLAAALTRRFLNLKTPTIYLLRTVQALKLLQVVFRPLGQKTPVELSGNRRAVERMLLSGDFSGYPLYATCPDPEVLEDIGYPLFLLGNSGLSLSAPVDSQAGDQISGLAHQVLTSLTVKLLREPIQAHDLIANQQSPSHDDLALEGRRIIELSGGVDNFELYEPELPLLQRLLSQIPLTDVPQYFRHDRAAHLIKISCRKLPDITRKPLYEELVGKSPSVKLQGSHYITCDAQWFLKIISNYYGQDITVLLLSGRAEKAEAQA